MKYFIFLFLLLIFLVGCVKNNEQIDAFAKCISEKGAKMYGAYWCGHCMDQKQMFGKSFKYINYIECSLPNQGGTTQACQMAGIESYPTWDFQGKDRQTGVVSFEQLAAETGCTL